MKYFNGIVSIVVGASMYLLGLMPYISTTGTIVGQKSTQNYSFYNMLSSNADVATAYKVFAIILMVVAGLLILGGLAELLKQANILKVKSNIAMINSVIMVLLIVSLVGLLISSFVIASKATGSLVEGYPVIASSSTNVAFGEYIAIVVSLVGLVLSLMTAKTSKKSSKKRK